MGEKKKTPITIDEKEYIYEDLTPEQQLLINHISDLGRKIETSSFNLDQLRVGQEAFISKLKTTLEE